jgi:tetratricopeptide (TPR) repeat protein
VVAVALCVGAAFAQDKAPPPVKPAETLTFDAVQVKPDELPNDIKIVEGMHCASEPARLYFETPSPLDVAPPEMRKKLLADEATAKLLREFPKPKRKASQSFQADGGTAGTVLAFEYASAEGAGSADEVEGWLKGYIWGPDGVSPQYPEWIYRQRTVIVVVSFPLGDRGAEWFKERLRRRFGVAASPWSRELADLLGSAQASNVKHDYAGGLKILADNEKLLAPVSLAHFLRGELASKLRDYPLAEKGYRHAIALHESREDPLEDGLLWATTDGLGISLLAQKKLDEAATTLARAAAMGRTGHYPGWSGSLYNLACVQSLRKHWPESAAALKEAIAADPKWKQSAKTDDDLAEARKRPEFIALLGL